MEMRERVSKFATLSSLLKIRKNNYVGVWGKGCFFDKDEIDKSIKDKLAKGSKVYCDMCEIIHKQVECPICQDEALDADDLEQQFYRGSL